MGRAGAERTPRDLITQAGYADVFGDEASASVPCVECGARPPDGVEIRLEDNVAFCRTCDLSTGAGDYLRRVAGVLKPRSPAQDTALAIACDEQAGDAPTIAGTAPPRGQPGTAASAERLSEGRSTPLPQREASLGERLIIGGLALSCFLAGLMAVGLSAWANHQAFGSMVDDPLQSRVWAWTGVIASVCSFGGFTFVYWHFADRRWKEGLRAAVFAVAGAVTSIVGTEMFMANTEMARSAEAEARQAQRPVIEAQVADWRDQLGAIPAEIRTVDGLEAYLAEVERVGRTHQKPYRDAKIELGQARRRAELEAQIADGRAALLALDNQPGYASARPEARRPIPSMFFAVMLEVFASQGTSVGLVALLILLRNGGNRHRQPLG
ncbi:MAG: hypothetical protein AAGJ32_05815 [Pseudomonadota bacterium]